MTSTDTDAHRYAETIADEVARLADGELDDYDLAGLDGPDRAVDAVMTWLGDLALDVEVTRNVTTGDVTAVTIARTLGGPACYVTLRAGTDAEVVAYWGRDEARVTIPAHRVELVTELVLDLYAEVCA